MSNNGLDHINRNEFDQNMEEMAHDVGQLIDLFEQLRHAVNVQAEVLGLLRYTLEKHFPHDRLEAIAAEYKEARQREIATANTPAAQA